MGKPVKSKGFTLVELLLVIAVIGVLVAVTVVAYNGAKRHAAQTAVYADLKSIAEQLNTLHLSAPNEFDQLTGLPGNFTHSKDVTITYSPLLNNAYTNLTPVQNGVLFHDICVDLITDGYYSVIHSKDGNSTQSVVMECDDNVSAGSMLITGWDSRTWNAPVARADLQSYIDSVPYDNWWTDRQQVVRGFYQQMISRFEQRGGIFPITSFWDPWANQWSGVPKQELPVLSPIRINGGTFCVQGYHNEFSSDIYKIDQNGKIEAGVCS